MSRRFLRLPAPSFMGSMFFSTPFKTRPIISRASFAWQKSRARGRAGTKLAFAYHTARGGRSFPRAFPYRGAWSEYVETRKPSYSRQRIRVYVLCRYRMHAERCRVRRSNCPNRAALRFSRLSWQLCRGVGVNGWRYSFYGAGPIRVLTPARILSAPVRARGET